MRVQRVLALGLCTLILAAAQWAMAQEKLEGFQLDGERWTYKANGMDLSGILLKPEGEGPFPAIIISHGMGGSATGFAMPKAQEMVKWGFVCIATSYTHAGNAEFTGQRGAGRGGAAASGPAGRSGMQRGERGGAAGAEGAASRPAGRSGMRRGEGGRGGAAASAPTTRGGAASRPGGRGDSGASPENLKRAKACIDILKSLPYVDKSKIVAYGNSMGAFLSVAMGGEFPDDIAAVCITAGGIRSDDGRGGGTASPSAQVAEKIKCPVLIFHGTADNTVNPKQSESLKAILDKNNVPNERVLFEGEGHNAHANKADEVYAKMKEFFTKHGILKS